MTETTADRTTPATLHAWHAGLALAMASVAEAGFCERLAEALASLVPIESVLLGLECKGLPPRPLYQRGIPAEYREALTERYYARGYMLDPFCLALENGLAEGFYHLSEIAPDDFFNSEYYRTYYLKCGSVEDAHFIVDLGGQRKVSLCVYQGRSGARFSTAELDLLRAAQPLVRELIRQFDERGGLVRCLDGHGPAPMHSAPAAALNQQIREAFMNFGSDRLTEREREIAHLLLRGHSAKSSAKVLEISPETVRMHRKNLYTKLEISSQAELFALFIDWLTA
ncbi:LuxR C-terminal-related transcriptional regulator [Pseudomonas sp. JS3066]|jgi:DNA-binding CsgD family transcriptional regulator|uniref:helix-turn-helix transcriptional regulator n=1 Tax=unclassified Pseudomonas TaxID=196821 RepID=UPI00129D3CA7|nr:MULTISPECIES: LuxR C-terminal-related transcriptional regulator [unclassified Pseudomonas]MDH4656381.1 LuxR family transcriptional regulator [Pseudomonas sp. BN606]MRK19528.1 LuxR family transcriptional regulator [Pseudomonas sp. JG-B]WVK91565.1 LuxR C-terminal-related transcriptional regulator [Pseudomonas sp. JS3066]